MGIYQVVAPIGVRLRPGSLTGLADLVEQLLQSPEHAGLGQALIEATRKLIDAFGVDLAGVEDDDRDELLRITVKHLGLQPDRTRGLRTPEAAIALLVDPALDDNGRQTALKSVRDLASSPVAAVLVASELLRQRAISQAEGDDNLRVSVSRSNELREHLSGSTGTVLSPPREVVADRGRPAPLAAAASWAARKDPVRLALATDLVGGATSFAPELSDLRASLAADGIDLPLVRIISDASLRHRFIALHLHGALVDAVEVPVPGNGQTESGAFNEAAGALIRRAAALFPSVVS